MLVFALLLVAYANAEDKVEPINEYQIGDFIVHFPFPMYELGTEVFYGQDSEFIDNGKIILDCQELNWEETDFYDGTYRFALTFNSDNKCLLGYRIDSVNNKPVVYISYKNIGSDFVHVKGIIQNAQKYLLIDYVDISRDITASIDVVRSIITSVEYKTPEVSFSEPILFRGIPWGTSYSEVKSILKEYNISGSTGNGMRIWTVEDYTEGDFAGKHYPSGNLNIRAHSQFGNKVEVAGYEANIYLSFVYLPVDGVLTHEESDSALFAAQYEINPADVSVAEQDLINKLNSLYGSGSRGKSETDLFGGKITRTVWNVSGEMKVVLKATSYGEGGFSKDEITISYVWTRGNKLLDNAYDAEKDGAKNKEKQQYNNSNTDGL